MWWILNITWTIQKVSISLVSSSPYTSRGVYCAFPLNIDISSSFLYRTLNMDKYPSVSYTGHWTWKISSSFLYRTLNMDRFPPISYKGHWTWKMSSSFLYRTLNMDRFPPISYKGHWTWKISSSVLYRTLNMDRYLDIPQLPVERFRCTHTQNCAWLEACMFPLAAMLISTLEITQNAQYACI